MSNWGPIWTGWYHKGGPTAVHSFTRLQRALTVLVWRAFLRPLVPVVEILARGIERRRS